MDAKGTAGLEDVLKWEDVRVKGLMGTLQGAEKGTLWICHGDLEVLWQEFSAAFRVVEAAGGIVRNPSGETLFIYRNGKWDLPKGKMEAGETAEDAARREVMEECGMKDLVVGRFVATTYHIYEEKQKQILKHSHWFEMRSSARILIPQAEEGISEAVWSDARTTERLLADSYPNIRLLLGRTGQQ